MALESTSREEIQAIAFKLETASKILCELADQMKADGVRKVLIHKKKLINTDMPAIENWIDTVSVDVRAQIRSFKLGKQSTAELNKKKSDARRNQGK